MSGPSHSTSIPGLLTTGREPIRDSRGSFTKVLSDSDPAFAPREMFWSSSVAGTFRGMHVPLPPHAARKLVFVTHGRIRDFVVDLRRGSPTFGELWEGVLDADSGGLVVPEGCAHGFEVVSDSAVMVYAQEAFYSADHDGGVHFASVGVRLASAAPVLSERDRQLPALAEFDTPFAFAGSP